MKSEFRKTSKGPKGVWKPPKFGESKEFALVEVEALKQFLKMRTAIGKAVSLQDGLELFKKYEL